MEPAVSQAAGGDAANVHIPGQVEKQPQTHGIQRFEWLENPIP